jgi:hypothetical protein
MRQQSPWAEGWAISETVNALTCSGVTTFTGETDMANRITAAFARMEAQIADRIANGLTTAEKVRNVHKTLDMDLDEYVKFQTLKTLAVAHGLLTPEEGQRYLISASSSS